MNNAEAKAHAWRRAAYLTERLNAHVKESEDDWPVLVFGYDGWTAEVRIGTDYDPEQRTTVSVFVTGGDGYRDQNHVQSFGWGPDDRGVLPWLEALGLV